MIWRDGALIEDPAGWAQDRGLLLGVGAFETLRVLDRRVRRAERHLARLERALHALGLGAGPDLDTLGGAVDMLARAQGVGDGTARLTVTGGPGPRGLDPVQSPSPRTFLTLAPAAAGRPAPAQLVTSPIRREPTSLAARHKTLSYVDNAAARRAAVAAGADEAALLTPSGVVAGAAAANIAVLLDEGWCTPPVTDGALPGTTRAALIDAGVIEEASLTLAALDRARAVVLLNAVVGVRAVARWDARAFDVTHPAIASLSAVEADAD
jgi:branched-subunit amino acid aminotransferase/4-amino-4-deoxychorismate lyase